MDDYALTDEEIAWRNVDYTLDDEDIAWLNAPMGPTGPDSPLSQDEIEWMNAAMGPLHASRITERADNED